MKRKHKQQGVAKWNGATRASPQIRSYILESLRRAGDDRLPPPDVLQTPRQGDFVMENIVTCLSGHLDTFAELEPDKNEETGELTHKGLLRELEAIMARWEVAGDGGPGREPEDSPSALRQVLGMKGLEMGLLPKILDKLDDASILK